MKRTHMLPALLIALVACSEGNTGPEEETANLSAKIDGVLWSPTTDVTAINGGPGLFSITGMRLSGANNYTMIFQLHNIAGPGTYALGVDPTVFGGAAILSRPPAGGWSTPLNGVAGELNITTLTPTRMVASFRFDTDPQAGSTGNPKVTEGTMDVPVSGNGGLAPANAGSKLTGSIAGPFNAASAGGNLSTTGINPAQLTIVANDGTRTITISIANMTGPGMYPLSSTAPVRTIASAGVPGNPVASWTSQIPGGSGSVQINSVTASRIIGSFNATLAPLIGGATGTRTVSGDFSIARLFP